jgi:hypothetical protein
MPVRYITDHIQFPEWAGLRYKRLDILERFREGTIYDCLPYPFYQELDGDNYIPLRDRRPSVIYNMASVVVTRSVSLLFSDKHWPVLHATDEDTFNFLQQTVNNSELQSAMLEAAYQGSLGSVLVLFVLNEGKYQYEVWNPKYCRPKFDAERELEEVFIMYPTYGYELAAVGFNIAPEDTDETFLYGKRVTTEEEIIYQPLRVDEFTEEADFKEKSKATHELGFVPGVWIKNFPSTGGIDSDSTYGKILHFCVEIDYQLSQCGRGLKYNSDPQLLIKEPPGDSQLGLFSESQSRVRSASNALYVGTEGDAKLLEISGQGQKAVLEFVKQLRQYALETARGSKKDPEHAYGNMSGRAMEILDEDLIALASVFRLSYGESGLKPLLVKMLKAAAQQSLIASDPTEADDFALRLVWGNWFDPTPTDLLQTEEALDIAVKDRRLYMSEARMIAKSLWNVGHAEPEEVDKEYPIPPEPELPELELQKQKLAVTGNGAGGTAKSDHASRQGGGGAGD